MGKTPIQWTDCSLNPLRFRNLKTGKVGHHCVKISPGCKKCYASTMNGGPYLSGLTYIAENTAKGEFFFDESVIEQVLRRRKPTKYFWCDMTDMFGEWVPDEWIDRCAVVAALTPQHTHQWLTKRSARMREYFTNPDLQDRMKEIYQQDGWQVMPTISNRWLGVSVEDRAHLSRIDDLRATPAAVKFVSFEPLLEDLGEIDLRWIDLAIWGGESGPGARQCRVQWIRNGMRQAKRDLCKNFVKQLGANVSCDWQEFPEWDADENGYPIRDRKGCDMSEWPLDLRVRELP